jgi:hypothetical protein
MKGSPWFSRSEAGREANILTSGNMLRKLTDATKEKNVHLT